MTQASQVVSYSSAPSTVTFPAISNGVAATITTPATTAAVNGSLTYQTTLPSGATTPQSSARVKTAIGGTNLQTLGYFLFSVNSTVSVSTTFGFQFTFTTPPTGSTYMAYFDESLPANGWNIVLGPGVVSGNTDTFAPQSLLPPLTFVPGDTYIYALVESSTAIAASSTTASYTGTKTVNYSYGYDFGYPSPAPNATAPPTNLSYTVATTVSVGSSPYPGPAPSASLTDEHVAETDTQALSSATFTTDSYVGQSLASGVYSLSLYGSVQGEPTSEELPNYTTIFTTPQLLDQYPETATSWNTNSPAASITYSFADGDNGTRTVNADGTYVDNENLINTTDNTVTLTENSDGSGSIVGPYYSGDIISSVTFSAPSGGNITNTINYTTDAQNYYGLPPSESIQDPTWYSIPPFYAETDTVTPGATLPTGCSTAYGTSGTEVQRVMTTLDTVIGYIETTTLSSYAIGNIPVCLVTNDVVNYAYDEQNNTPYLFLVGQLGTEVVTTNETLNLQAGATSALPASKSRSTASVVAGPASAMSLAGLENHVLTSFAKARVVHEHQFLSGIRSRNAASMKAILGGAR